MFSRFIIKKLEQTLKDRNKWQKHEEARTRLIELTNRGNVQALLALMRVLNEFNFSKMMANLNKEFVLDTVASIFCGEIVGKVDFNVLSVSSHVAGKFGDRRVLQPLIHAVKDKKLQFFAIRALGELGETKAVPAIIAASKAEDLLVREIALGALGKLGDKRATARLIEALNSTYNKECDAAAAALAKIGDPQSGPALSKVYAAKLIKKSR